MKHLFILMLIISSTGSVQASMGEYKQASKAIRSNDAALLDSVITSGIDVNEIPAGQNMSLLSFAVYFNREEMVTKLIRSGAKAIDINNGNALVLACATNKRNKSIIEALLKSGVDINSVNKQNQNCLYSAVISADLDFFTYLAAKGASPSVIITPSPEIYPDSVTIKELVNKRVEVYTSMKNRITKRSSGTHEKASFAP